MSIFALNGGLVVEPVARINPAVRSHAQRIDHSVRVAAGIERPEQ